MRGTRRGANRCIEKKWVIFRTIKGAGSGRHRTGSCTPVLRDFAKNGDFAHTGFEWRWGLPRPLKHALGCVLAAERDPALGGSCTPVLRDFAKIGNFAHTGFERGWILPHPLKHAPGMRLVAGGTSPGWVWKWGDGRVVRGTRRGANRRLKK